MLNFFLDPIENAWLIFNAFIEHNWDFGGLHRLGVMWIVINFWLWVIGIIYGIFMIIERLKIIWRNKWLWKRRKK